MWYRFSMNSIFDLTPEEAKAILEEADQRGGSSARDKRVCICGHSAGAHAELSRDSARRLTAEAGYGDCRPSRMACPCKSFVPVLVAENARKFTRKTVGGGKLHALWLGVAESMASGFAVEWLDAGKVCWKCGTGENIHPVALEANGIQVDRPSQYNAMLCAGCLGG